MRYVTTEPSAALWLHLSIPSASRGRSIDAGLIPVFLDQAVFHAHNIEVVPLVFAIRIVGIFCGAIPHHHRVRTVDQRQRRSIDPLRLDLARRASRSAAHELFEAVAALRDVR